MPISYTYVVWDWCMDFTPPLTLTLTLWVKRPRSYIMRDVLPKTLTLILILILTLTLTLTLKLGVITNLKLLVLTLTLTLT